MLFRRVDVLEQNGGSTPFLEIWGQAAACPQDTGAFLLCYTDNRSIIYGMSSYTIHYKSHNNVVYSCKYHVVWCPKYRRSVLLHGVDARLKEIIQSVCSESDAEILALEVMPEHVHLLVEVDPQCGIHRLVRAIKGRSSRLPTLWTTAYFVSTVGGAPLEDVNAAVNTLIAGVGITLDHRRKAVPGIPSFSHGEVQAIQPQGIKISPPCEQESLGGGGTQITYTGNGKTCTCIYPKGQAASCSCHECCAPPVPRQCGRVRHPVAGFARRG